MLVWLQSKLRCGGCGKKLSVSQKNQPSPFSLGLEDNVTEPLDDTISDEGILIDHPIGVETPPGAHLVSLVDEEGFEWALNDGPPRRPSYLSNDRLFIPLKIRPKKGYLKNNILTETEVPDPSPLVASNVVAMLPMSQAQDKLLRSFRAAAMDINYHNGAHVRSHSRRRLIRNVQGRPRSLTESTASSGTIQRKSNVVTHIPSDVRGIIAMKSVLRRY